MDVLMQWLAQIGAAWLQMLTQPFYYVAILIIIFIRYRQMTLERKLFAVKLYDWKQLTVKAIIYGLLAGIILSLVSVFFGTSLTIEALWWLWGAAALLSIIRIRFLRYAYSAGLLVLSQWVVITFTSLAERADWLGQAARSLAAIDGVSLLLLAALLHLVEALFIRRQGMKLATPFILEGKRGKLIGGYRLQGFWPIPLFLLVPAANIGASTISFGSIATAGATLPFDPLFSGSLSASWSLLAFPVMIGFSEVTISKWPEQKLQSIIKQLYIYSAVLLVLATLAWWQPILLPFVAVVLLLMHEVTRAWTRMQEIAQPPLYVPYNKGLHVLGVVPATPAIELGIIPGETIVKVNNVAVNNQEELYEALMINAAFCKLDILNRDGELRFAQRARFAGDHHQLGVILVPHAQSNYQIVGKNSLTWLHLFKRNRTTSSRRKNNAQPQKKNTINENTADDTEAMK
ncbi:serine protease [Paenibacillus yanchengensis]|uniref:Serine protease n=1 Tax=Paenibacillus yanchengensis TaxID=2035833 RepID=A0ABW4YMI1_9BACL